MLTCFLILACLGGAMAGIYLYAGLSKIYICLKDRRGRRVSFTTRTRMHHPWSFKRWRHRR